VYYLASLATSKNWKIKIKKGKKKKKTWQICLAEE
jgi:hypothetical protein